MVQAFAFQQEEHELLQFPLHPVCTEASILNPSVGRGETELTSRTSPEEEIMGLSIR